MRRSRGKNPLPGCADSTLASSLPLSAQKAAALLYHKDTLLVYGLFVHKARSD